MNLAGIFAPIPTPFDDRDRVDTGRLKAALAQWLKRPLTGFVVLGSNGEAALMDDYESDQAIVAAREAIPHDRGFIVGTGRESTQATIKATKRAAEHGADAVLVRTPGFFKSQMTNDVFVRHYTAVADASPVPVLLYNFTAVTGVNLLPAAVARLATHPNIVGMKESGGDVAQVADLVSQTPDDFTRARRRGRDVLSDDVRRRGRRHPRARGRAAGAVRAPLRADEGGPARGGDRAAAAARAGGAPARRDARRARTESGAEPARLRRRPAAPAARSRCPSRSSPRCATRWRNSRKSPHEPASRYRSHPARPRPEPDRAARDARDGVADGQPSRSADAAPARRRARAAGARVPRRRRLVRVRGVGHRHVGHGNGGREPGQGGHARHRRRHRLLRRSARADVRALRRDGDAARRRVGHGVRSRRAARAAEGDAGRRRRDGPRGNLHRRAEPGARARGDRARARRADDRRRGDVARRHAARRRRVGHRRRVLAARRSAWAGRPGWRRSSSARARSSSASSAAASTSISTLLEDYWLRRKYHHTMSSTLVYALYEALSIVEEEGLDARWARHERNHRALVDVARGARALACCRAKPSGCGR